MVNYSNEEIVGMELSIYFKTYNVNSVINEVFAPFLYINFFFIIMLSSSWAVYLVQKLMKDFRKEKLKSKLRLSLPNDIWENSMANFKTNRIKNAIMLVICLSEFGSTVSVICSIAYFLPQSLSSHSIGDAINAFKGTYEFTGGLHIYINLEISHVFRVSNAITAISLFSIALFVRILTQYMVQQYSYFKPHLNLKIEVIVSIYFIFPLFIVGIMPQLFRIFYICIILVIFRELILLFFANKKLCLLLKQRLDDAILHENQPCNVILYYRLAYREYKYSSRIFLIAFLIQILGFTLYCIQPIIMAIIQDIFNDNINVLCYIYDLFVNSLELILLTLGTSTQIILYLVVSLRRLLRNVCRRIHQTRNFSSSYSSIKILIESNQSAYMQNS